MKNEAEHTMVWERGNGRTFKSTDLATIMKSQARVK
jgi:hypothetical protein